MKITVYNFKGGVGKTRISMNLALTLGFGVVTNDLVNPLEQVFDSKRILKLEFDDPLPELPDEYNIIFDLGGYVETRVISALQQSEWALVPVTNVDDELAITKRAIESMEDYNKNIVVIANRTVRGDYEAIKASIRQDFDYPVFEIKQSTALKNLYKDKRAILDTVAAGGLLKYHYKPVADQFKSIIQYINGGK